MSSPTVTPRRDDERVGAAEIVEFALARYALGRSTDGVLFVTTLNPTEPKIAREIRGLRTELSRALWRERSIAVGRETISTSVETLLGLAEEQRPTRVHLRSARVGTALQVDLGDSSGRFVEISPYGWELRDPIAENDPEAARATFKRTTATHPLPTPVKGGSRDELRELLGLAEDDARWLLIWGWLVASYFEDVPRPILWALGPQGSGKSTRARMVLNVVDPSDSLGREPGKNERDDTTAAAGRYLPSWDNISSVTPATSDWLCRLVTGVEIGRRALYTDDDLRVSTLRRSGVATSIVLPFGLGADALERLVLVELERVAETERRPESTLWQEFRRRHGRILGALLDDVAGALRHIDAVREAAPPLPRMADYALILYALDAHLDIDEWEGFGEAYARSVRGALADRATADPLTSALLALAKRGGGKWSGTPEMLLNAISNSRPDDIRAPWPSSPSSLSAALTRGQETLRAAGLEAEKIRSHGVRRITLRTIAVEGVDAA